MMGVVRKKCTRVEQENANSEFEEVSCRLAGQSGSLQSPSVVREGERETEERLSGKGGGEVGGTGSVGALSGPLLCPHLTCCAADHSRTDIMYSGLYTVNMHLASRGHIYVSAVSISQ